jgi:hypothetical protein
MLRDNLVGLIEPMLSSAGAYTLALGTARKQSSDDRPPCLENPRPEGAESTLTENAASPFHAEPKHIEAQLFTVSLSGAYIYLRRCKVQLHKTTPAQGALDLNGASLDVEHRTHPQVMARGLDTTMAKLLKEFALWQGSSSIIGAENVSKLNRNFASAYMYWTLSDARAAIRQASGMSWVMTLLLERNLDSSSVSVDANFGLAL